MLQSIDKTATKAQNLIRDSCTRWDIIIDGGSARCWAAKRALEGVLALHTEITIATTGKLTVNVEPSPEMAAQFRNGGKVIGSLTRGGLDISSLKREWNPFRCYWKTPAGGQKLLITWSEKKGVCVIKPTLKEALGSTEAYELMMPELEF